MTDAEAAAVRGATIAKRLATEKTNQRNGSKDAAEEAQAQRLFAQVIPSAAPLDLGDDCAEMLRSCWDRRRSHAQDLSQLDIDRLCAGFRSIGKHGA